MNLLALLLSASIFFQEFPVLREQENWDQIISLGVAALEEAKSEEIASIHGKLASSYFYLGDLENAEKHASFCFTFATTEDEKVHGLYLLSAMARAKGDFENAKAFAKKAYPLSSGEIRGKVLFNWGAAEADDPNGDLSVAEECLQNAIEIFSCVDDLQRTSIRLGKVYLLQEKPLQAKKLLDEILNEMTNKKTRMHGEFVLAQVEKALGNIAKAKQLIHLALMKAEELGATRDEQRFRDFSESL